MQTIFGIMKKYELKAKFLSSEIEGLLQNKRTLRNLNRAI